MLCWAEGDGTIDDEYELIGCFVDAEPLPPEKRLIAAGRKTRDALRVIRDIVRRERKANLYDKTFIDLDDAVEDATDGLIDISAVFEVLLNQGLSVSAGRTDVINLHDLQNSLTAMKAERAELQEQLQKYADDLQELYNRERQKRAELADAYEKLKKANKLRQDFLSTVNHELTSPLVPLDLSLQIIEKGDLNEEQKNSLIEGKQHLQQYKRQLDGLISYASLISQTHVVNPEPIAIPSLLDNALEPLKMLAAGRNINLEVHPVPDDVELTADQNLLSGAIYQIVHNAIKFNQSGGFVDLKVVSEDNGVTFQVRDDGVGIPDAVMNRLGEDFNQIVDALRRGVEGLGLGLAFCSYVATEHNGRLTAARGGERGTMIKLWLPDI